MVNERFDDSKSKNGEKLCFRKFDVETKNQKGNKVNKGSFEG